MKNLLSYLFLLLFNISVFGAEEQKVDYQDKFLQLVYDKSVKYSDAGENAIAKAVDVISEEAEPTLREYIKWSIISHLWDGLPWIFSLGIGVIILAFLPYSKLQDPICAGLNRTTSIFIFSLSLVFFGFTGTFLTGPDPDDTSALTDIKMATLAYSAPRIYIINNVAEFIKDSSK